MGKEDVYQATEEPRIQLYWHKGDVGTSQLKGTDHGQTRPCNKTFCFSLSLLKE